MVNVALRIGEARPCLAAAAVAVWVLAAPMGCLMLMSLAL